MNQNPNPYESTNYGSNQPGGSNPNNPYEQYEPTQRAEPYQQSPYAPPPVGQGSSPYSPPQYPPQQSGAGANPYSYPTPPSAPPPVYNQAGAYTPTPPPTAPRRSSGGRILLIAIAALVVLAGIIAAIAIPLHNTQVANSNATATAQINGTATARAVSQAHATATAQFLATATAVANTYPFSANVVLNDPLTDNSHGYKWKTDSNCMFTGGAYHAVESNNNTYYTCPALGTNFSNFTYQVTMQVNKGDIAGITFRGDEASSKNYAFIFSSKDGSYVLFLYTTNKNPRTLQQGTATQFNTGLGQKNDVGVVVRGNSIDLYVNKQKLASTSDSTLSSGQAGTIVYDTGDAADVSFTNAMVWGL